MQATDSKPQTKVWFTTQEAADYIGISRVTFTKNNNATWKLETIPNNGDGRSRLYHVVDLARIKERAIPQRGNRGKRPKKEQ